MPIFLFTVDGYESKGSQVGLLPGIPQMLLMDHKIANIKQGSKLLLVFPGGDLIQTNLAGYYLNVPNESHFDPTSLPIIPVLPSDVNAAVPIGTRIYAYSEEDEGK